MKLGRRVVLYLLYCTSAAQGDCIQRYIVVVASASETRFVSKVSLPKRSMLVSDKPHLVEDFASRIKQLLPM